MIMMKIPPDAIVFISAPFAVLLAVIAAYALHPYAAIGAMVACAAFLFWLANRADAAGVARTVGYSCAFACLLLVAAIPSGEIGKKSCPDQVVNIGEDAKISYFYSPFCPNCPAQEAELDALISSGEKFRLEKFDLRYCRADADRYGFSGTPCIAIEKAGKLEKACGVIGSGQISAALARLG